MYNINVNRRKFLQGAAATLAFTTLGARGMDIINPAKPVRVGLIGSGWYGKVTFSDSCKLYHVTLSPSVMLIKTC